MSEQYYVAIDREKVGPLTLLQVRDRIAREEVDGDTLAWQRGRDSWDPLSAFSEFDDAYTRLEEGELQPSDWEGEAGGDEMRGNDEEELKNEFPEYDRSRGETIPERTPDYVRSATEEKWTPVPFRVGQRIAARLIDVLLLSSMTSVIGLVAFPSLFYSEPLFFRLVTTALAVVLEAGFLCSFGVTPGKAFLGIAVRDERGKILSFGRAFWRSFRVWLLGLGLLHPLIFPITIVLSYLDLRKHGWPRWDREQLLRVAYAEPTPGRWISAFFGTIAAMLLLGNIMTASLDMVKFMQMLKDSGVDPEMIELLEEAYEVPPVESEPSDGSEYPDDFTV